MQDTRVDLPLHIELVINLLLETYPRGAQMQQKEGILPLHLPLKFKSSVEIIKLLIEAYPSAVEAPRQLSRSY
jgi:hypothetical protein